MCSAFVRAWEREAEEAKNFDKQRLGEMGEVLVCVSLFKCVVWEMLRVGSSRVPGDVAGRESEGASGKHQAVALHMCVNMRMCVLCSPSGLWLVNLQVTGSFR